MNKNNTTKEVPKLPENPELSLGKKKKQSNKQFCIKLATAFIVAPLNSSLKFLPI